MLKINPSPKTSDFVRVIICFIIVILNCENYFYDAEEIKKFNLENDFQVIMKGCLKKEDHIFNCYSCYSSKQRNCDDFYSNSAITVMVKRRIKGHAFL